MERGNFVINHTKRWDYGCVMCFVTQTEGVPVQDVKMTVLVVDDEPVIVDLVRNALERAGYAVITAGSASEALKLIRHSDNPIDLLLTDVQMPHMTGIELASRLRDYRTNVSVAFMTGFVESGTPNGIPVLHKPFLPADLVRRIGEMLGGLPLAYGL